MITPGSTIGIFGGGQLGKMTALAAFNLGYRTHIFCPDSESPAFAVSDAKTTAFYDDMNAVRAFGNAVDVATFEFENIPYETVQALDALVPVRPNWNILHLSQNRLREKQFVNQQGIPTTQYCEVRSAKDLETGLSEVGRPAILKTTELGYDGKGQIRIDENSEIGAAWNAFRSPIGILEAFVPFKKELSVIVARGVDGDTVPFPVVENRHQNGILDQTIAPAKISEDVAVKAQQMAMKLAKSADVIGLLAVEFFLTEEGELFVNELAPRPHNSGHWTQDGCMTSQFEQFVRAICGLPLGSVEVLSSVTMVNLVGEKMNDWLQYLQDKPNAKLHLYGKKEMRTGRKMGHVNLLEARCKIGAGPENCGAPGMIIN